MGQTTVGGITFNTKTIAETEHKPVMAATDMLLFGEAGSSRACYMTKKEFEDSVGGLIGSRLVGTVNASYSSIYSDTALYPNYDADQVNLYLVTEPYNYDAFVQDIGNPEFDLSDPVDFQNNTIYLIVDTTGAKSVWYNPKQELVSPYTELTYSIWNVAVDGRHKYVELTADMAISITIADGDEAILMLTGNGYIININGVEIISDSVSDMMIGITRGNDKLVVLSKNVNTGSVDIFESVMFSGTDITTTSGIVSTSSTDSSFGHTGIDSTTVLPSSTAGRIWMQWLTGDINGVFGFTEGSTAVGFASMKAAFFKNDIAWGKSDNGTVTGISGVPAPTNGNYYGLYRDAAGAIMLQESTDQVTWTTLHTFTTTSTAALRVVCDLAGSTAVGGVGTISHPKRNF